MIDLVQKPFPEATISCDKCSFYETFDGDGEYLAWQEVIDYMKRSGWKITKEDDEWVHICPACRDDE